VGLELGEPSRLPLKHLVGHALERLSCSGFTNAWLETDLPVPIANVHLKSRELCWRQHAIVCYIVPRSLKLIEPLLEPMLRGDQIFEVAPTLDNNIGQSSKVDESEDIYLPALEPRVLIGILLPFIGQISHALRHSCGIPPVRLDVGQPRPNQVAYGILKTKDYGIQSGHAKSVVSSRYWKGCEGLLK
jgi:hypothetical protein